MSECRYPVHGSVTHMRGTVETCDFCGLPADYEPTRPQPSTEPVAVWREALRTYSAKTNPHDYDNADTEAARIREANQAARREALEQAERKIIDIRAINAGDFKRSGAVWEAYDRAVLDCVAAVSALKENPNAG